MTRRSTGAVTGPATGGAASAAACAGDFTNRAATNAPPPSTSVNPNTGHNIRRRRRARLPPANSATNAPIRWADHTRDTAEG
ncbi:hypothetical protein Aglo01_31900 [Actinokineospora globicatena]|nr:hypothetical protein Aglo01_31900 [Actinokineospora globicatena]GLW84624.1 hypothetical protein Aglo02_22640 [Actinokineospora globicatena]